MDLGKLPKYYGYLMSAVFFFGGLFVIFGVLIPDYVPEQFRWMAGIVLILWAIYRFVLTHMRSGQDYDE